MKNAIVKLALYNIVDVHLVGVGTITGWLIPDRYDSRAYMILPLNEDEGTYSFRPSYIKSIKYHSNGVVLK